MLYHYHLNLHYFDASSKVEHVFKFYGLHSTTILILYSFSIRFFFFSLFFFPSVIYFGVCIQVRNKQFYSKGKPTVSRSFHSSRQRRVNVLYTGVWDVNPKQSTKKAQLVLKFCFILQTHAAIPWYIYFIIKIISPSLWYLWVKLKLQEDILYLSCSFWTPTDEVSSVDIYAYHSICLFIISCNTCAHTHTHILLVMILSHLPICLLTDH